MGRSGVWLAVILILCAGTAYAKGNDPKPPFTVITGLLRSPDGQLVEGMCVWAQPVANATYPPMAQSDSHGRYRITADVTRINGDHDYMGYFLVLDSCSTKARVAPEWWKHQDRFSSPLTIVVGRAGKTTTVNIALRAAATVAGHVRIAPGVPFADTCVGTLNLDDRVVKARTDATGSYTLTNLIPGRHKIWADVNCNATLGGAALDSTGRPSSTTPIIESAEFILKEGQTVSGVDFTATL